MKITAEIAKQIAELVPLAEHLEMLDLPAETVETGAAVVLEITGYPVPVGFALWIGSPAANESLSGDAHWRIALVHPGRAQEYGAPVILPADTSVKTLARSVVGFDANAALRG